MLLKWDHCHVHFMVKVKLFETAFIFQNGELKPMQAYKRQTYLCSLIKLTDGGNYNPIIIMGVLGRELPTLTSWTAKQNFPVKMGSYSILFWTNLLFEKI